MDVWGKQDYVAQGAGFIGVKGLAQRKIKSSRSLIRNYISRKLWTMRIFAWQIFSY